MTTFSVQTDELTRLTANLATFQGQLHRATGALSGLGEAQTGHPGLACAVRDFVDHWRFAIGKIAEHANTVEVRLKQAAEIYRAADDGIARATGG